MSEKRDMAAALQKWQDRLKLAEAAWAGEREKMGWREQRLEGTHKIRGVKGQLAAEQADHVRNICLEMIESQVDSSIPQPKVTAVREEDEALAKEIEDLLRNLLDRLPMERLNDLDERVCPTQGGDLYLVSWVADREGKGWLGDLGVSLRHPRQIVPQPGIYEIREMDYLFVKEPTTKAQVLERFGVDMESEAEEDPGARSEGAGDDGTGEKLTMNTAYFRNKKGGIGRFIWINDTALENLEDYQVRKVRRCRKCGAVSDGKRCRLCGGALEDELQEDEVLTEDLVLRDGTVIPAESPARDENGQIIYDEEEIGVEVMPVSTGLLPQLDNSAEPILRQMRRTVRMEPTRLPYYRPDCYPLVLRKNVSQSGQLLGSSDIDALEDVQNGLNKVCTKINGKVLGGGSFTTVKTGQGKLITDGDNRYMEVENPADLACIRTYNTQVDIGQDLALRDRLYEEGRQTIGVTDSMQGRHDPTATSKVAKEFAAAQAAGRLESKRVMKKAAYQDLFELMFKFMLAYSDEPRSMTSYDKDGNETYSVFDRRDFLYQDEDGSWHYNTDFLFSCDTAAPLASNRAALWQETRINFETGAMGNPTDVGTLIRFWRTMEKLHYPLAGQILGDLQEEKEQQEQEQQMAAAQQAAQMPAAAPQAQTETGGSYGVL